jgi:hypothetical protein
MKHIFLIFLISAGFILPAQKPTKKEVKEILQLAVNALKTKDSLAFKDLFVPDTTVYTCDDIRLYQEINGVYFCFNELLEHLSEVLRNNVPIHSTKVEKAVFIDSVSKPGKPQKIVEYEIEAAFKMGEDYWRMISFPVIYYKKRLLFLGPCSYGSIEQGAPAVPPVKKDGD